MKPKLKLSDLRMNAGEFDKVMRSTFAVPAKPVKKGAKKQKKAR